MIAPDLPGAGESDPLSASAPSVSDFAAASLAVLDHFKVPAAAVYAVGFGSSVAVELAQSAPDRIKGLILRGLLAPDAQERAAMTAALAPPIEIERDGGHWYRTWLMLRDSLVWWPWYERRKESLRRVPADFGAKRLHKWTLDVMRRRQTYGDMIHAALRHDAPEALARLTHPVMRLIDPLTPLSVYDQSPLIVRDCLTLDVEADPAHHAAALASACEDDFDGVGPVSALCGMRPFVFCRRGRGDVCTDMSPHHSLYGDPGSPRRISGVHRRGRRLGRPAASYR